MGRRPSIIHSRQALFEARLAESAKTEVSKEVDQKKDIVMQEESVPAPVEIKAIVKEESVEVLEPMDIEPIPPIPHTVFDEKPLETVEQASEAPEPAPEDDEEPETPEEPTFESVALSSTGKKRKSRAKAVLRP